MNTAQLPPVPPTGPSAGLPVEPRAGPPRKSRRTAILVTAIVVGALAVLGGIGALVGHASGHVTPKGAVTATQVPKPKAAQSKATVKPQPAATVTVTTTAPPPAATQPAAIQPAATQPAAPPADSILAKFYGTGSGSTGTFTVPSDGNWHLSWAYANGTLFAGQAENFIVYEYGTDGTQDQALVNALAVGTDQPTAVPVYSDQLAGSHAYFQVITDDAHWELVVVSGTS
jgi:hypothetical protein